MTEYIDREDLAKHLDILYNRLCGKSPYFYCGFQTAVDYVKEFFAADVSPVRHGRWEAMHYEGGILDGTNFDKCSVCGYERIFEDEKLKTAFNYCPNCGALMDLEGE